MREAACLCGQLRLEVTGEPRAVSICHCLSCKRRTGSAFGMQAGFAAGQVEVFGRYQDYVNVSDEPDRKEHVLHFCPVCGSQVFYTEPTEPDLVVVSAGAFADPSFPPPTESGYDSRRHSWVQLPDSIRRHAPELWWDAAQSLYEEGRYAEAAAKGREVVASHPDNAAVLYNTACAESLAGETAAALDHLAAAIALWEGAREVARDDSDFEALRDEQAFRALVA